MDFLKDKVATKKFIQAVMVQDHIHEFLEESKELGIDYTAIPLLEMIRDLVRNYTEYHSLSKYMADNILILCSESRFTEETSLENKKKRFDIVNEIIDFIHQSKEKPEYPFYQDIMNRYYPTYFKNLWNRFLYYMNKEWSEEGLNQLVCLEYYILFTHTHIMNDKEFTLYFCEFMVNGNYLESIDALLIEIPELGKDITFLRRVRQVLTENENLKKEAEGIPVDTDVELEEEDKEVIADEEFWKLHNKIKRKINRLEKDS